MNHLRFGLPVHNFLLQALFPRRWLLACSLVVILPALFLFGLATGAVGDFCKILKNGDFLILSF